GNIDKTISAYTTALYYGSGLNAIGEPWAMVTNPPNPDLRWERVSVLNLGLDFQLKNKMLEGSVDFFKKQGLDLIGNMAVPASLGITSFRGNSANTRSNGIDLSLGSMISKGRLNWQGHLLMSYINERVTKY